MPLLPAKPVVASCLLLLFACAGCKTSTTDDPNENQGSAGANASMTMDQDHEQSGESGAPGGSGQGGGGSQAGQGGGGSGIGGADAAPPQGGGGAGGDNDPDPAHDAGTTASDAGPTEDATVDGGIEPGQVGMGSCCAEHDTPGCSNADLQVCVCELLPSCCTEAWNEPCVLIVNQKYCQPGVRDCVCGDGDGQWQQHSCCDLEWTDTFCDNVAETKCGAVPGCM